MSIRRRIGIGLFQLLPAPLYQSLRRVRPIASVGRGLLGLLVPRRGLEVVRILSGPLQGLELELDLRNLKEMVVGSYEPHVARAIADEVLPGKLVFDVGAHFGYFTLLMARLVKTRGRVVAFEPEPSVRAVLRRNLQRSQHLDFGVVTVVDAAVSESSGTQAFLRTGDSSTGHLTMGSGDDTVKVTTLDENAERFGPPDFVKVDVEGTEADVLRGARTLLAQRGTVFLVEVNSSPAEEAVASILREHGYRWMRLTGVGRTDAHLLCSPH